jgi:hypothetical protein
MRPDLREMVEADRPFILSSWLKSYRNADTVVHVNNEDYYKGQADLINQLIDRSNVIIACDPEYPTSMFGYVIYEDNVIHYIYCKFSFRRHGVATLLHDAAGQPSVATHWTYVVPKLPFKVQYNPYRRYL